MARAGYDRMRRRSEGFAQYAFYMYPRTWVVAAISIAANQSSYFENGHEIHNKKVQMHINSRIHTVTNVKYRDPIHAFSVLGYSLQVLPGREVSIWWVDESCQTLWPILFLLPWQMTRKPEVAIITDTLPNFG
jgi:hypothetical protein